MKDTCNTYPPTHSKIQNWKNILRQKELSLDTKAKYNLYKNIKKTENCSTTLDKNIEAFLNSTEKVEQKSKDKIASFKIFYQNHIKQYSNNGPSPKTPVSTYKHSLVDAVDSYIKKNYLVTPEDRKAISRKGNLCLSSLSKNKEADSKPEKEEPSPDNGEIPKMAFENPFLKRTIFPNRLLGSFATTLYKTASFHFKQDSVHSQAFETLESIFSSQTRRASPTEATLQTLLLVYFEDGLRQVLDSLDLQEVLLDYHCNISSANFVAAPEAVNVDAIDFFFFLRGTIFNYFFNRPDKNAHIASAVERVLEESEGFIDHVLGRVGDSYEVEWQGVCGGEDFSERVGLLKREVAALMHLDSEKVDGKASESLEKSSKANDGKKKCRYTKVNKNKTFQDFSSPLEVFIDKYSGGSLKEEDFLNFYLGLDGILIRSLYNILKNKPGQKLEIKVRKVSKESFSSEICLFFLLKNLRILSRSFHPPKFSLASFSLKHIKEILSSLSDPSILTFKQLAMRVGVFPHSFYNTLFSRRLNYVSDEEKDKLLGLSDEELKDEKNKKKMLKRKVINKEDVLKLGVIIRSLGKKDFGKASEILAKYDSVTLRDYYVKHFGK